MNQPEMIVNFEVYEDGKNFCGIAEVTLPNVQFITQNISGAGIGGNIDAVAKGMVSAMNFGIKFRSPTGDAINLFTPDTHKITVMAADQGWDAGKTVRVMANDKFVVTGVPKNLNLGNLAPASVPDVNTEYSAYYFAGYRDGKKMYEVDPMNMICVIGGKDYLADVRKAIGK